MLSDIWKRGIDISEVSSQAGTKLPAVEVSTTDSVAKLVDKMLQNNVTSLLINEDHNARWGNKRQRTFEGNS